MSVSKSQTLSRDADAAAIENDAARNMLAKLSDKDREVLDLVIDHRSNKEVANLLDLAEVTIEGRLRSVRAKLGTRGRNDTARLYSALCEGQGKTLKGFSGINEGDWACLGSDRDEPVRPPLVLRDAAFFVNRPPRSTGGSWPDLEVLQDRLSPSQRLLIVGVFALLVAIAYLVVRLLVRDVASNGLPSFLI